MRLQDHQAVEKFQYSYPSRPAVPVGSQFPYLIVRDPFSGQGFARIIRYKEIEDG
jgi:hypothetical protein